MVHPGTIQRVEMFLKKLMDKEEEFRLRRKKLKEEQLKEKRAEFQIECIERSQSPHPGWSIGHEFLGGGGFGVVTGVIALDENGMVRRKYAVKDTYCSPDLWRTQIVDQNEEQNSLEYFIMRDLHRYGSTKTVQVIEGSLHDGKHPFHRLYMEHAPFGDLVGVFRHYRDLNDARDASERLWIPEPAIWWMLECLAESGRLMEQGDVKHRASGWHKTVAHRDIKPAGGPEETDHSIHPLVSCIG
jgi:hypothetical protein